MTETYDDLFALKTDVNENFYVFLRLYDTKYKNGVNTLGNAIFGQAIHLTSEKHPVTNLSYTHATISATLDDRFLGMTPDANNYLWLESIDKGKYTNSGMQKVDKKNSVFSVFYSKLSKSDYIKLKKILNYDFKYRDKFKYNCLECGNIGINHIMNQIKDKFNKQSKEDMNLLEQTKFVCSTFCTYILSKLNKFKTALSKGFRLYNPTDVVTKLKFEHLVTGKFNQYNTLIEKCIKNRPEFKLYYNNLKEE